MSSHDLIIAIRVINAIGCVLCLWVLSTGAYRQWQIWNHKTKSHWWALFGWCFVGMEANIESIAINVHPSGPRIFLQTIVILWTAYALLIDDELQAYSSIPWKAEGKEEGKDNDESKQQDL